MRKATTGQVINARNGGENVLRIEYGRIEEDGWVWDGVKNDH